MKLNTQIEQALGAGLRQRGFVVAHDLPGRWFRLVGCVEEFFYPAVTSSGGSTRVDPVIGINVRGPAGSLIEATNGGKIDRILSGHLCQIANLGYVLVRNGENWDVAVGYVLNLFDSVGEPWLRPKRSLQVLQTLLRKDAEGWPTQDVMIFDAQHKLEAISRPDILAACSGAESA